MFDSDIFLSARPAAPWSSEPLGPFALAAVAALLVVLTVWTYLGHPQASRRRVTLVLGLRLLALLVALVTAVRPQVGVQEDPKLPSTLLLGVDLSESMTVRDEVNNQARIAAVRRVLERCEPTLEELRTEQNVAVKLYAFGPADFTEANGGYDPNAPAAAKRSDYGTYLARTLDRWQGVGLIRGHLVIGDGADNGTGAPAATVAERWRAAGGAVSTFLVGTTASPTDARDVAVTDATADPSPVPVKTDFVLTVRANAFGFPNARVPVKVQMDAGDGYKDVAGDTVTLDKERDNEIKIPMKAPDKPGEVKLRVTIPVESVPGDVAPANNELETYLTITKEGMRVLVFDRLTLEHAAAVRTLLPPKAADGKPAASQFALVDVTRQRDEPPTPGERKAFDFDQQQYDVLILGNVSAKQLTAIDPQLPEKIAEQVTKKGMGLLLTGGHATFLGSTGREGEVATGWRGTPAIENLLPVDLGTPGTYPEAMFSGPNHRFQYLPTVAGAGHYLNRLASGPDAASLDLWGRLNDPGSRSRFTGLSRMGVPKPTATVYAVASDARAPVPLPVPPGLAAGLPPLLVGHQIGDGNRGRVLAFAGQDTYLWQKLGQPKSAEGRDIHARFWRGLVRYLAHQEEDEGAAFARPARRRLPVRSEQTVEIGLRGPGGAPAVDPTFEVKVLAPGEPEAAARPRPYFPAANGKFTLPFVPTAPGEYTVKLTATGKTSDGTPVKGEATARFLVYPEASDEMLRTAADPDFLKAVAAAGGGRFHRLEDLPAFLRELKSQPPDAAKPKPRYLPDWRRDHSHGFLPAWLVAFVALLGTEWGLRRLWGMV